MSHTNYIVKEVPRQIYPGMNKLPNCHYLSINYTPVVIEGPMGHIADYITLSEQSIFKW